MASNIHLRESESDSRPRIKVPPQSTCVPVPFSYTPSDDGTDENLLILLHGLGDTHAPFSKLGLSLKLPQTATLALRGSEQIPFLYQQAFQWYTSFDPLGDMIDRPNPTPALKLLSKLLDHLIQHCSWPPSRIHLLGFAQGGSVAAEFGLKWWKSEMKRQVQSSSEGDTAQVIRPLGSIVSISGLLLSYPTLSKKCQTPVLLFHRSPLSESASSINDFKRGFESVVEVTIGGVEGMPRSKDEWEPIMRFWSEQLGRRQVDGLCEVLSGGRNATSNIL